MFASLLIGDTYTRIDEFIASTHIYTSTMVVAGYPIPGFILSFLALRASR
jgi:hypothetical protein